MNPTLPLLLIPVILLSCSGDTSETRTLSEARRGEIRSEVINRFHGMIKYAEAGELENMLAYFDESGEGSYVDEGNRYPTFQDMTTHYRATWKVAKQDYGVPETSLYVLSEEFVYVTSSSTLKTALRDGVTFQPRPWAMTTLWQKRDGGWKIHSMQQFTGTGVPVEPPPAP